MFLKKYGSPSLIVRRVLVGVSTQRLQYSGLDKRGKPISRDVHVV